MGVTGNIILLDQQLLRAMNQSIRFCTAADGVRLAYAVRRRDATRDGGNVADASGDQWRNPAWQPWLEAFSREHMLLRCDCRGCGLSDREPDDLSFESWVRDLESVSEAAGLQRFDLLAKC